MFTIKVDDSGATASLNNISQAAGKSSGMFSMLHDSVLKMGRCAFAVDNINQALQTLSSNLDNAIAPGATLNTSMADLSAVAGVTGKGLKMIEGYARDTAKTFGGSAAQSVESYKLILSQLSPEIAKVPIAMAEMGKHIAITSKTMGGDTRAAAEVLTTAMNQFQVSTADPIKAADTMGRMMNIMAAAAKEGSAELPAIKSALEQSGMAAKAAGISFAETNAAIQVLDKAGKKGSEGGVALRNMFATLSQGRFLPKDVQAELTAAGVNMNILTNQSLGLTERMKPLQSIMGDTALVTKLFGRENSNAAIALLSGLKEVDRYTSAIQGTNTATEQAGIIMDSYAEKMSRQQAWLDDLKIGFFNLAGGAIQGFKILVSAVQGLTPILMGMNAAYCLSETAIAKVIGLKTKALWNNTTAMVGNIKASVSSVGAMGFYNVMTLASVGITYAFSAAIKSVGKAIYAIPIIGWIAAGITLIVTAFKILWEKCEGFRRILFATGEVFKAVFHNIGVVVKVLWENILKPYFMFWWDFSKTVAGGIWSAMQWCWNGIVSGFQAVGSFFVTLWNGVISGVTTVSDFFTGIWSWLQDSAGGVATFISSAFSIIVAPIKALFGGVWDFVGGIFDKIGNAFSKLFSWIGKLWNKLFPKDSFKDLGDAANVGLAKGSESWQKSQEQKKLENKGGVIESPQIESPATFKSGEKTKKVITPSSVGSGKVVNLNNVKGSTSYGAIASKLAPVRIGGLSSENKMQTKTLAGLNTAQMDKVASKQNYQIQPKQTNWLQDIGLNVRNIAAGIGLLVSVNSLASTPVALSDAKISSGLMTQHTVIDPIQQTLSETRVSTDVITPSIGAHQAKGTDKKQIRFDKFCDQIVINMPVGTTEDQVEHFYQMVMKRLNSETNEI